MLNLVQSRSIRFTFCLGYLQLRSIWTSVLQVVLVLDQSQHRCRTSARASRWSFIAAISDHFTSSSVSNHLLVLASPLMLVQLRAEVSSPSTNRTRDTQASFSSK